jgi:nitrate reductase cytochrome c-type subunit
MRTPKVSGRAALSFVALTALVAAGCSDPGKVPVPDREGAVKSTASVRAERRAYDGAPPTVPHQDFGTACGACHDERGQSVTGVGFAPASPHDDTSKAGATTRCRQCHVFQTTGDLFVASEYEGLGQDLAAGDRATPGAPPRIPHRILMRENCAACHDGPAAREEIRTSHPERTRCDQCHVPVTGTQVFESSLGAGLTDEER